MSPRIGMSTTSVASSGIKLGSSNWTVSADSACVGRLILKVRACPEDALEDLLPLQSFQVPHDGVCALKPELLLNLTDTGPVAICFLVVFDK